MREPKYTREQLWAKLRQEYIKVDRMRERQFKLREIVYELWEFVKGLPKGFFIRELIRKAWFLLKDTPKKVEEEDKETK